MELSEDIEMQLWDYLDGTLSNNDERQRITHLIEHDNLWHQKYEELSALHASLSAHIDNDMPSMSFSRNVMDAIAQNKVASPAKKYINPAIIKSIAAMFILGLTICFIYACSKINWTQTGNTSTNMISDWFNDFSFKPYKGIFVNTFIGINIILALLFADKLLHRKRYTQNS
jgi:hypothetical protein